jgi:hypothetical protein
MIIKSLHKTLFSRPYFQLLPPRSENCRQRQRAHLVGVGVAAATRNNINISTSLSTLHPALLDKILLLQHAAGLLHELAHGGVVLAVLGAVVLGGLVAVTVEGLLALHR